MMAKGSSSFLFLFLAIQPTWLRETLSLYLVNYRRLVVDGTKVEASNSIRNDSVLCLEKVMEIAPFELR